MTDHAWPWPTGASTGIGSLPGTDIAEAQRIVLGELPALPHLPEILTAGQTTVAVRMPDHADLCALLRQTGPLAATSANRSGGPDTRTVADVLGQLDGRVPLVLYDDDQRPPTSLPSTLVDLTAADGPRILRPGPLADAVSALLTAAA